MKNDNSFLENFKNLSTKLFDAPKGEVFLYAVYNKKNNLIKLGKAKNPIKRIKSHIAHFVTYGEAEEGDLGYIFTRFSFIESDDKNPEEKFLKNFGKWADGYKSKCIENKWSTLDIEKGKQIKKEFWQTKSSYTSALGRIRRFMRDFTRGNYEAR
jgi:hypothetical protein